MRRNVAELQVQATPSHTNSDVEQESDAACTMLRQIITVDTLSLWSILEYSSSKESTACVGGGAGDMRRLQESLNNRQHRQATNSTCT